MAEERGAPPDLFADEPAPAPPAQDGIAGLFQALGARTEAHAWRIPGQPWRLGTGLPSPADLEDHRGGVRELGALPREARPGRLVVIEASQPEQAAGIAEALGYPCQRRGALLWFWFPPRPTRLQARALAALLRGRPWPERGPLPLPPDVAPPPGIERAWLERIAAERVLPPWTPRPDRFQPRPAGEEGAGHPAGLRIRLGCHLELSPASADPDLRGWLERWSTLPDPHRPGRQLSCGLFQGETLSAPKGLWSLIREYLDARDLPYRVEDQRLEGGRRPLEGPRLGPEESRQVAEVLAHEGCFLRGRDLERLALSVCARRGVSTLILTERIQDWVRLTERHLGLPPGSVGILSREEGRVAWPVTVADWRHLAGRDLEELARYLGQVIVDQAERIPARALIGALRQLPTRYVLGLMEGSRRADGMEGLIAPWFGPGLRVGALRPRVTVQLLGGPAALAPAVEAWVRGGGQAWILTRRGGRQESERVWRGSARYLLGLPAGEGATGLFVAQAGSSPGPLEGLVRRVDRIHELADEAEGLEARLDLYRRLLGEGAVPGAAMSARPERRRRKRPEAWLELGWSQEAPTQRPSEPGPCTNKIERRSSSN